MNQVPELFIEGIPSNVSAEQSAIIRSRLFRDVGNFLEGTGAKDLELVIRTTPNNNELQKKVETTSASSQQLRTQDEISLEERSQQYNAVSPTYKFEMLVLPEDTLDNLLAAVDAFEVQDTVFGKWNLNKIQPGFRSVLNLHGAPGTGKTLAAHAIAHRLGKKILLASYADIESKFHGDGPKNLKAIFHATECQEAILFIDEADSLLSKRLNDVTSGSEQAINSMRSQLLLCLESFKGIVIFATNLVENYDKAFETRVRHIEFRLPDKACRQKIWSNHLPDELPCLEDVSIEKLAEIDDICGRDIRNAIFDAANKAALRAKHNGFDPVQGQVTMQDLVNAVEGIKSNRINPLSRSLNPQETAKIGSTIKIALESQGGLSETPNH